jgi:hypothetical protein
MRGRRNNLDRKARKSSEGAAAFYDFSAGRDFSALLIFLHSRDYSGELRGFLFHKIDSTETHRRAAMPAY